MPHQCTQCGKIYSDASKEILTGCSCGTRFFYYIRQERLDEIEKGRANELQDTIKELDKTDKVQIEKEIREITGVEELDAPVILDLESVKVIGPGKFEIDIVNLFNKKRPLIYKLGEGKYIIDLASTLKANTEEIDSKIKNQDIL
jgi:predicted  nucleic acid-binding Zn-ribbon protein